MLSVCPTPIGNLGDLTLRVIDALREADLIACEDTRRTGRLLEHLGIEKEMVSFYEQNELRRLGYLTGRLRAGDHVALVSDAGMPGLSDPGFSLISACLEQGLPVTVLPGPSAVVVALVASGLPTDRYTFVGFLPRGRPAKLISFLDEAGRAGGTLVAFESPRRLPATLRALAERWPQRRLAVCREMTKLHEEVVRGSAVEVASKMPEAVRGEVVLVLEPAPASHEGEASRRGGATAEEAGRALSDLLGRGWGARQAASFVAGLSGLPERSLYTRALELKRAADR
jgi:16S rRNA (cytidine1402-2'-O)-methyltransferase